MNRIFIFDLDGTLIDSSHQILEAANLALTKRDLPKLTEAFLLPLIGLPPVHFFSKLELNDLEISDLITEFRNNLKEIATSNLVFFPGAIELLSFLKKNGDFVAIATNKPTNLTRKIMENSLAWPLIDICVGTGDVKPKPSPEMIFRILDYFAHASIPKSDIRMIGDRNEDVLSGIRAGISTVLLEQSGHQLDPELQGSETLVLPNIFEYFQILRKSNS